MPDQYAKNQKTCIGCRGLAILLSEKKFDNMKVSISDSYQERLFLHRHKIFYNLYQCASADGNGWAFYFDNV